MKMSYLKPDRSWYMPKAEKVVEEILAPELDNAHALIYQEREKIYGIGFGGKRAKPDFHYRFTNLEKAQAYVADWLKGKRSRLEWKAEQHAQEAIAKQIGHGLVAGDILSSSWGYDQTNWNFFQVVEAGAKSIVIREIGLALKAEAGVYMSYTVVPEPGYFVGEPCRKVPRVHGQGCYVPVGYGSAKGSDTVASKWNGKPCLQTEYA